MAFGTSKTHEETISAHGFVLYVVVDVTLRKESTEKKRRKETPRARKKETNN